MRSTILIFVIAFLVSFGGGYLIFHDSSKSTSSSNEEQAVTEETNPEPNEAEKESIPAEAEVMSNNGCINCHAVKGAGIAGGTTGPDLSHAYKEVEGKHGKSLDEFLQAPTSAVMSGVIADNPLSEEDRKGIVEFLKKTSDKQ